MARPPRVSLYGAGRTHLRLSLTANWVRVLLGAGTVLVIGRLVDRLAAGEVYADLVVWAAVLLGLRALLTGVLPPAANGAAVAVERDLRRRVVTAIVSPGAWWRRTGSVVGKATEGVEAVGSLAGTFFPQLIGGMSSPLFLGLVVAIIDLPTALALVVILPVIPALLRLLERRFASVSARYRETADQLAARFLDGIQGLRTLKALDRADSYGLEIATEAERLRVETMKLLAVNQLALLAVDTLFTVGTVGTAAAMAGWRLSGGAITVGEAVAIVLLGVMLIEPLSQIGRYFYVGAIGRAAAGQIRELLATGREPVSAPSGTETGVVEFDRVEFAYPEGARAVDDVTFRVEAGQKVAVVGPSGAGKSTIAHLVLGLLHPDSGRVSVGGRPVLVPQRPFLFHGSVADNLRLGGPEATDAEMWAALEGADLAELVRKRGGGLESPVGERGLQLSGGEAQRLAIARALLVDAPVIVLDEPTSNVDLESEARIRRALDHLTRSRTVIVIAHRRSTIAGVDRVLFLDGGRLRREADPQQAITELTGES